LRAASPIATDTETLTALWDLVWAGEVTNDSIAPLRAVLGGGVAKRSAPNRRSGGRPRPGRLTTIGPPAGAGRWSLVAPLLEPVPTSTQVAHAAALQLLERHGVVTREAVLGEGVIGGFSGVYGVLKMLEERGQVRRGYFVTGLGAAQFAVPGAVDRLRGVREAHDPITGPPPPAIVLAATDPAQPYGAGLSWPASPGRPARQANALVVLGDGVPLAWFDRRSHHLVTFPDTTTDDRWAVALAELVRSGRSKVVEVRKVNGSTDIDPLLRESLQRAGFSDSYRGLVLRG
jgi:ATP-dependent helicase Lhr and Lhr-like helicase